MKFKTPLFSGIIDAVLAANAQAKAPTPTAKPQPAAEPTRIYGEKYGLKQPEPALSW